MSVLTDLRADGDRCGYCDSFLYGARRYDRRRVILPATNLDAPGEPATVLDIPCPRCGIANLVLWEAAS